jgi:ABC-type uncharacterized transport system substrate-binding protein
MIVAALTLAAGLTARPAPAGDPPRIGVLAIGDDAETASARSGLADGLRLAGLSDTTVERAVPAGEAAAAEALREIEHEGVQVVVAVGTAASRLAHASVRDRFVVCAAADDADAAGLRLGGNACVVAGAEPAAFVAALRGAGLALRPVGVVVPSGDDAARDGARALAETTDVAVFAAVAQMPQGVDAVWLPPSVSDAGADAVARALKGRGVPLIGSRRGHLDAGCAVVVRADPRDLGGAAAVLAQKLLLGADAGRLPVRRTTRRLVEVNLPAAKRLEFRVPLLLLAWADTVVRAKAVPR